MIEITYWKSKITDKTGYTNPYNFGMNIGVYIYLTTTYYFIPVSIQVRKLFNQD